MVVSYSSQTSSVKGVDAAVSSQGMEWRVTAVQPSLVDAAVAAKLEVLDGMPVLRAPVIEAVEHARAFHRRLLHPFDEGRLRQTHRFENGRRDVDDVVELVAHLAFGL